MNIWVLKFVQKYKNTYALLPSLDKSEGNLPPREKKFFFFFLLNNITQTFSFFPFDSELRENQNERQKFKNTIILLQGLYIYHNYTDHLGQEC